MGPQEVGVSSSARRQRLFIVELFQQQTVVHEEAETKNYNGNNLSVKSYIII